MNPNPKINIGTRLAAMVMDHLFMTLLAMIIVLPAMIPAMMNMFSDVGPAVSPVSSGPVLYCFIVAFSLFFCKDSFNGRSIAKRILGQQVVVHRTDAVAGPVRCFVRNLLAFLWPVEVICTIVKPERRLGDLLAGTRVAPYDPARVKRYHAVLQTLAAWALACMYVYLLTWPIRRLERSIDRASYIPESFNPAETAALKQFCADSLGGARATEVRVYDSMAGLRRKYIVLEVRPEQDGQPEDMQAALHDRITRSLNARYTDTGYVGRVQYVFTTPLSYKSVTQYIDQSRRP